MYRKVKEVALAMGLQRLLYNFSILLPDAQPSLMAITEHPDATVCKKELKNAYISFKKTVSHHSPIMPNHFLLGSFHHI